MHRVGGKRLTHLTLFTTMAQRDQFTRANSVGLAEMEIESQDNEAFFQRVASDLCLPALSLEEQKLAYTARQYAELVFEYTGYVFPIQHPKKVARTAWVIAQKELLLRKTTEVH